MTVNVVLIFTSCWNFLSSKCQKKISNNVTEMKPFKTLLDNKSLNPTNIFEVPKLVLVYIEWLFIKQYKNVWKWVSSSYPIKFLVGKYRIILTFTKRVFYDTVYVSLKGIVYRNYGFIIVHYPYYDTCSQTFYIKCI